MFRTQDQFSVIQIALLGRDPIFLAGLRSAIACLPEQTEIIAEVSDCQLLLKSVTKREVDLILIDLDLCVDEEKALEVIKNLKKEHENVQLIVLVKEDSSKLILELLRAGAKGCLLKSSSLQELHDAIRVVLHNGTVITPLSWQKLLISFQITDSKSSVLSLREQQILELMSRGWANKRIALELFISKRTVETHSSHIYGVLGVESRTAAVIEGIRVGYIKNPASSDAIPA